MRILEPAGFSDRKIFNPILVTLEPEVMVPRNLPAVSHGKRLIDVLSRDSPMMVHTNDRRPLKLCVVLIDTTSSVIVRFFQSSDHLPPQGFDQPILKSPVCPLNTTHPLVGLWQNMVS